MRVFFERPSESSRYKAPAHCSTVVANAMSLLRFLKKAPARRPRNDDEELIGNPAASR